MFRDIIYCTLPEKQNESILQQGCSKTFFNPFYVSTRNRLYILYAATLEEREMWIDGFNYIIKSTQQVQKILTVNNQNINEDIEQQTKLFKEKALQKVK